MIGVGTSITERRPFGGTPPPPPPPPPPPAFNPIAFTGDSISVNGSSAANQYDAYRTDKNISVFAEYSRDVGSAANLNDGSNTMMGHVAETMAGGVNLVGGQIGANDLSIAGPTSTNYFANLAGFKNAVKAVNPAAKVIWCLPFPYRSSEPREASYDGFMARRATVRDQARDPAVWGQFCDYPCFFGDHPDFSILPNTALFGGDGLHPDDDGHNAAFPAFRAFMDTLLDPTRATSTALYGASWPASETNLAAGETVTRRIVVAGLAHGGIALTGGNALAISGAAGNPQLRVNGAGVFAANATGWLYNGDVIEYRLTLASASNTPRSIDLTIGSETRTLTYRTVAQVAAANYVQGGTAERAAWPNGGTNSAHIVQDIAFPATGTGIIDIGTGVGGAAPTSVTWNGQPCVKVFDLSAYTSMARYRVPVTGGEVGDLVINYASDRDLSFVSYGTLTNVDPVPVSAVANAAPNPDGPPNYATVSATVPASGIALGLLLMDGGSAQAAGSVTGTGNTQIASAFGSVSNGEKVGLIVGKRSSTGAVGFSFNRNNSHGVGIAVWKAAGT